MKITRITVSVIVALNIASAARAQETLKGEVVAPLCVNSLSSASPLRHSLLLQQGKNRPISACLKPPLMVTVNFAKSR